MFLSTSEVAQAAEQLIKAQPFLATLAADPSLRGFAHALSFVPTGVKAGRIEFAEFSQTADEDRRNVGSCPCRSQGRVLVE